MENTAVSGKRSAVRMRMLGIVFLASIFIAMFFVAPLHAQATPTPLPNPLPAFTSAADIPKLIGFVLRGLFGLIGTIALVIFIYGGFLWMTALGDEGKVKKGWETMIWAGLGLILIFGSYAAIDFLLKALLGS